MYGIAMIVIGLLLSTVTATGHTVIFWGVILAVAGHVLYLQGMQKFQQQSAAYQSYMEAWQRAYYCQRCDCVFDPATRRSAAPGQMRLWCISHWAIRKWA
jgi:hypothetical protein